MRTWQTRWRRFWSTACSLTALAWQTSAQFSQPRVSYSFDYVDLDGDRQSDLIFQTEFLIGDFGNVMSVSDSFFSALPDQVKFLGLSPLFDGDAVPDEVSPVNEIAPRAGYFALGKSGPDGMRYGWVQLEADPSGILRRIFIRRYAFDSHPGRPVAAGALPDGTLQVKPSAGGLSLSWPTVGTGFQLEQSTAPVGEPWIKVTDSDILERIWAVPVDAEARFFRLSRN